MRERVKLIDDDEDAGVKANGAKDVAVIEAVAHCHYGGLAC